MKKIMLFIAFLSCVLVSCNNSYSPEQRVEALTQSTLTLDEKLEFIKNDPKFLEFVEKCKYTGEWDINIDSLKIVKVENIIDTFVLDNRNVIHYEYYTYDFEVECGRKGFTISKDGEYVIPSEENGMISFSTKLVYDDGITIFHGADDYFDVRNADGRLITRGNMIYCLYHNNIISIKELDGTLVDFDKTGKIIKVL